MPLEFAQYTDPSTFTHMGRNARQLKRAIAEYAARNNNSLPGSFFDAGSGCITPVTTSHMLGKSSSQLYTVDASEEIHGLLSKLVRGEPVKLADYTEVICNMRGGTPRPNSDFTNPEYVQIGLREMELAGLDPTAFYNQETGEFKNHEVLLAALRQGSKYNLFTVAKAKIIEKVPKGKRVPLLTDIV